MTQLEETVQISPIDLAELRQAKWDLEHPSIAIRLTNLIGAPIEKGFQMLPAGWSRTVHGSVHSALTKALQVATFSLGKKSEKPSSDRLHRTFVGTTGAVGGLFGLAALPVELPISTTTMLRSIVDIAQSEGHDLSLIETRLACLEVFALGGKPEKGSEKDNRYWVLRAGMAKAVSEAATYLANRGIMKETAPAVVRFIAAIAARFGVIVSEQIAAKAVPIIGAASGSAINLIFINHFQRMARGHFVIKRLEKKYGTEAVESIYRSIAIPITKKELQQHPARSI